MSSRTQWNLSVLSWQMFTPLGRLFPVTQWCVNITKTSICYGSKRPQRERVGQFSCEEQTLVSSWRFQSKREHVKLLLVEVYSQVNTRDLPTSALSYRKFYLHVLKCSYQSHSQVKHNRFLFYNYWLFKRVRMQIYRIISLFSTL